MEITDIRVRKINSDGRMKAIVSVTFDDCFVVHDIKVIDGHDEQKNSGGRVQRYSAPDQVRAARSAQRKDYREISGSASS